MNESRRPKIWLSAIIFAAAILLPLALYFPLKSSNTDVFFFLDPGRAGRYVWAVAAWIFLTISMLGTGLRIWGAIQKRMGDRLQGLERDAMAYMAFGIGMGAHMLAMFALAATGLLKVGVILPLNLLAVLWGAGAVKVFIKNLWGKSVENRIAPAKTAAYWTVLVAALIPTFLMLGAPVAEWDELVYQLTIPKRLLEAGQFVRQPFLFFFDWPLNMNLIYAESMAVGTHVTARFFHFTLGALCAGIAAMLTRRWTESRLAGWLAAALFLGMPVVQMEMGIAMVDLALSFFLILAFLVWEPTAIRLMAPGKDVPLPCPWTQGALTGVFIGLAAGIKYMGLYGLGAFVIATLLISLPRKNFLFALKFVFGMSVVSGILFAPWAIKNLVFTGNPLYPQFYGLFGGVDWSPEVDQQWHEWIFALGRGKGIVDLILLPWRLTFESSPLYIDFAGEVGPFLFPAVLIGMFAPRFRRKVPALILAFVYGFLWFTSSQQVRFLIPAIVLGAAFGGAGMAQLMRLDSPAGRRWILAAALVMLGSSWFLNTAPLTIADANFTVTFGQPDNRGYTRTGYLYSRRGVDNTLAVDQLNMMMEPGDKALFFFDNRGYHMKYPYIADGAFEASRIVPRLMGPGGDWAFYDWLVEMGVTHILWNQSYSEGPSGKFVDQYYPEYSVAWKKFLADHGQILYESDNMMIYKLYRERAQ